MSKRYPGGLITKTPVVPTTSAASGVWTLDQAITYIQAGTWPVRPLAWIGLLAGYSSVGQSVAVDSSKNVYLCGSSSSGGSFGFQMAKYNSSGTIQWQKSLTGNNGGGQGVAVDSSGNMYVCGFDATPGLYNEIQIAKYDTSGAIQWQRSLGGSSSETGYSIAVDSSSNIYICGYSDAAGFNNFQIAKYNTSGSLQWQRNLSRSGGSGPLKSIAVDSSSNVYVCGRSAAIAGYAIQIAKYNTSGSLQWQRTLSRNSGVDGTDGNSVAVDSSGNVYVCGNITISGIDNFEIAKYDTSGAIQWQRSLSGVNLSAAYSIAVDSLGNVYVCGESNPSSNQRIQIAKYNTSGTIQWQRNLSVSSSVCIANGITVDAFNNFYICGYYNISGNVNFVFAKLPVDGSLTGTYSIGSLSFTYASSSLTDASTSLIDAASSLTDSATSLTSSATSLTNATSGLSSSVTIL